MIFRKKENTDSKEVLKSLFNGKIYFGPFTGVRIPDELYKKLSVPEIIGLYESCLHPVFSDLLNKNIENIVLVGGNNGYYSAGISNIFSPKNFYVYEIIESMHPLILSWFQKNNFNIPYILGEANSHNFANFQHKIDLLLIDCEGAEIDLLNPQKYTWQKNANIIAEIHPFYVDNLISTLAKRFSETHTLELIYDDFLEDNKIKKILDGLQINIEYSQHPKHRWITENDAKVFTSGIFMYFKMKNDNDS